MLYVMPLHENIPSPPLLGFFAYTCGCVIVVEDLHSGSQNHWLGHAEEISTLAVSHDAQVGEAPAAPGWVLSVSLWANGMSWTKIPFVRSFLCLLHGDLGIWKHNKWVWSLAIDCAGSA